MHEFNGDMHVIDTRQVAPPERTFIFDHRITPHFISTGHITSSEPSASNCTVKRATQLANQNEVGRSGYSPTGRSHGEPGRFTAYMLTVTQLIDGIRSAEMW